MQRFITYSRVSTQQQGRSGLGLEAQAAAVRTYAAAAGGVIVAEFVEVESGKRNDRPQLERALQRCRLSGAVLLVAKLDRLSRNAAFLMTLQASSVQFVAADMPEANSLTVGIMALVAQQEREAISARTKAALAAAKARGVKLGKVENLTNTDTTAANAVRSAKASARNAELLEVIEAIEIEAGAALSLREIAEKLNAAGFTTARGAKFQAQSVKRIKNSGQGKAAETITKEAA